MVWWPAFLRYASLLICAPPSFIDIASVHSSTVSLLRSNVTTPFCGLSVGEHAHPLQFSREGRCVLTIPGGGFTYALGRMQSPPFPHSVTGFAIWYMGAPNY